MTGGTLALPVMGAARSGVRPCPSQRLRWSRRRNTAVAMIRVEDTAPSGDESLPFSDMTRAMMLVIRPTMARMRMTARAA